MKFRKIGIRTLKSCISVFLALSIYLVLHAINISMGITEKPRELIDDPSLWYAPTNFYTPFFAGIGAVYALSRSAEESKNQAKLRSLGSIVGGYYGFVIIAFTEWMFLSVLSMESGTIGYNAVLYTITAIGIIGLIMLTVKLKISYVTFISCLTYLSVTVSIRNGGMNAFLFATNRILSTMIGVFIAMLVNAFPYHPIKNKNILFVSSVDNIMLNAEHRLSPFMEYKINDILHDGCNYTFMTTRAMTSLGSIFQNVHLVQPIVVMTGCATYDPATKSYDGIVSISPKLRKPIEEEFEKRNVSFFSYLVHDNALHAYYNNLDSKGIDYYYELRKHQASYSFVKAIVPSELEVAQYVVIDKNEVIDSLVDSLNKLEVINEFNIIRYPFARFEGYSFLKLNYKEAKKYTALERIIKDKFDYLVCYGSGRTDIEAMKKADFAVCLQNAPDYVKEVADYVIPSEDPSEAVRLTAKIFHTKNYKKLVETIKEEYKQAQ